MQTTRAQRPPLGPGPWRRLINETMAPMAGCILRRQWPQHIPAGGEAEREGASHVCSWPNKNIFWSFLLSSSRMIAAGRKAAGDKGRGRWIPADNKQKKNGRKAEQQEFGWSRNEWRRMGNGWRSGPLFLSRRVCLQGLLCRAWLRFGHLCCT